MTRSQQTMALRARDDGLRRVRKLTWRMGLLAAAGAAFIGVLARCHVTWNRWPAARSRPARRSRCS